MCVMSLPFMNSNWSYHPESLKSELNRRFCQPCDLEIGQMTTKNNRAHLCHFKIFASFRSFLWIQTVVTVRKRSIGFDPCDLQIWRLTLKNNRAPPLCHFKLWVSFHSHLSIQTRVTVRKHPDWGKICFELCDFDLRSLNLALCTDISLVNSNNHGQFQNTRRRT